MPACQTRDLPCDLERLVELSIEEDLLFLRRLREGWVSGANRFTGPGEAFFVARQGDELAGVCGLNLDPYCQDPTIGRLRHFYVAPAHRRRGIGRALVDRAVSAARPHFRIVRLRTDTTEGALFYEAVGFSPTPAARDATHELQLKAGQ